MCEADFKNETCATWRRTKSYDSVMCIETEETEPGFPDVICITDNEFRPQANFYEFKVSDNKGVIKFKPSQPRFYRRHPEMQIIIVAHNNATGDRSVFPVTELFEEGNPHRINENLEVHL